MKSEVAQCESCHNEHLVAFSCKRRGFCHNCGGRRMSESAIHMVDYEMMRAELKAASGKKRDLYEKLYFDKYPKGVDYLVKKWSAWTTYFDFPAAHWLHLRHRETSNEGHEGCWLERHG